MYIYTHIYMFIYLYIYTQTCIHASLQVAAERQTSVHTVGHLARACMLGARWRWSLGFDSSGVLVAAASLLKTHSGFETALLAMACKRFYNRYSTKPHRPWPPTPEGN